MSTGCKISEKEGIYFLTFQIVGWVDIFTRKDWMEMVFKFHAKYKKGQNYQLWTHENHAEHIYSQKFIEQKINYIHKNPVRAGIVKQAEDYLYSSAQNYADEERVLEVTIIDFLRKTVC